MEKLFEQREYVNNLSALANVVNYSSGETELHRLAIKLNLIKDDNFIFQYDLVETDTAYKLYSAKNDCVLNIFKDIKEVFKYSSFNTVLILIEKGYIKFNQK